MTTTMADSKAALMKRALDSLGRNVADSTLTIPEKLALTCRALFDAGHDPSASHIPQFGAEAATHNQFDQHLGF